MHALAKLLNDARADGRTVALPEGLAPADIPAAMRVQAEAFTARGETVAGWKVAVNPEFGPVAAPIAARLTVPSGATIPLPGPGFIGIELEVALRLKADVPTGADRAALLAATDAIVVGIEICATRYAEPKAAPFPAFVADEMANLGYVLGAAVPIAKAPPLEALTCRLAFDGKTVFEGPARHAAGDPLGWAITWAAGPRDALGGLKAGQFVTTGNLCGLLPVEAPCLVEGLVEGVGGVTLRFA